MRARSVLEPTAFQTREVVVAMEQDSGIRVAVPRVDGGMVVVTQRLRLPGQAFGKFQLRRARISKFTPSCA